MVKFDKLIIFSLLFFSLGAAAQDIHFSQFNQSPLTLNPALTGNYPCDWRAGALYRSQWSVIAPYTTYAVYFDAPFVKGIGGTDNIAGGLYLFNDESGDGNLTNLTVLVSAAYHKGLGNKNHYISLGVQGGFSQKTLQTQNLFFGTQFDGTDFNQSIISGENFAADAINNGDLNVGLSYKGKFSKSFSLEVGGASYHLLTPNETFLGDVANELGMRFTGHGRAIITAGHVAIIPSGVYMTQSGASETVVGLDLGYFIENPNFPATFFLTGYTRLGDAILAGVAFDYKNFRLGASYDINTSDLKVATGGKGGLELSLVYTGCILPVIPKEYVLPCVRYF